MAQADLLAGLIVAKEKKRGKKEKKIGLAVPL